MVVFCYCCADSADMVCQGCGHVEVLPDGENHEMHPLVKASWDYGESLGDGEVGFVGKVDVREALSKILPGVCSDPTKVQ